MTVIPSTIRGQIIMAFLACFLFMAFMIWINYRMIYLAVLVLLLSFIVFFVGGKIVRPYRMLNEVQRLQELLMQSHKNTAIGTLTSGIAHEINNPLNNIVLTLETLIEDQQTMPNEERHQFYQEALDQTDRAAAIVNNLLEFSRANPPPLEEVDLEELITKTIRLLTNEFKRNRIKIFKELRGPFPTLYLDRSGLQQVLVNLMLNGIQAMPNGGQLKITVNRVKKEVQIDIADTGMGIPSENLSLIFKPFFTTKKNRAGLGLSLSYSFLQKLGGRIDVQSTEGQGSTFSFMIPIAEVQTDP
ncbi:MAG: hypothetical protein HY787_11320 [Deltaproteobacteria bacterium]|nr:hypothetical protein [Deltaproteobacteria bacterium]